MPVWVVSTSEWSHYALWRLDSSSFMVIVPGPALSYLHGSDYYLLDKKFEPALKQLRGQVNTHSVSIWDKAKQETLTSYMELTIEHHLELGSYEQLFVKGLDIWLYAGILMISDNLKTMWENVADNGLKFDSNPPIFAGSE